MRLLHCLPLVVATVHVAAVASADQFFLSLDQTVTGQSNIFGLTNDPISDGAYYLRPSIRFFRPGGTVSYDLSYTPSYQVYFQSDGLNGADHFSRSTIDIEVVPDASWHLHADVADFRATTVTDDGPSGIPDVVPRSNGRINRIFTDLEYEHQMTRSLRARGIASFQRYSFTTFDGVDSLGFGGEVETIYEPVRSVGMGGSLIGSFREYDEHPSGLQPSSRNAVVNPNFLLTWSPYSGVSLELRAGPAVLFTRTDASDVGGDPAVDEEFVTGFVRAELAKQDSWGHLRLAFRRAEDASAGSSGSTTIRDSATAELMLRSSAAWTANVTANWNRRESKSALDIDVLGDAIPFETTITQYWFDLRATRKLTDRLHLGFMFRYLRQDREDVLESGTLGRDFDNLIGQVSIRYGFAPLDYSVGLSDLQ